VIATRESGSKALRAQTASSQVEQGNRVNMRADWNRSILDKLDSFPFGAKDDQVDALVRAFAAITNLPPTTRKAAVPLLSR
jgi:predicted phage terminase large subunit-like protein